MVFILVLEKCSRKVERRWRQLGQKEKKKSRERDVKKGEYIMRKCPKKVLEKIKWTHLKQFTMTKKFPARNFWVMEKHKNVLEESLKFFKFIVTTFISFAIYLNLIRCPFNVPFQRPPFSGRAHLFEKIWSLRASEKVIWAQKWIYYPLTLIIKPIWVIKIGQMPKYLKIS